MQKGAAAIERLLRESVRDGKAGAVGVECERFAAWGDDAPLKYSDPKRPLDASRLLEQLAKRHCCWSPVTNASGQRLGFATPDGKVSLEPGSQLEFSAGPTPDVPSQERRFAAFEKSVSIGTDPLGLRWPAIAVNPFVGELDLDVIPLPRYGLMTDVLSARETMGLQMMRLTTSIQVNLDYRSEADAMRMLRAALLASPLSYALFANSPFYRGKPAPELSHRGRIWLHTDPDRSGLLPEAFAQDFGFQKYAELAMARPMLYAQNAEEDFVSSERKSLGQLVDLGRVPDSEDNRMHALRQLFFDARLKPGYIEVRSIDGLPPIARAASAAFWTGFLYSTDATSLCQQAFGSLDAAQREALYEEAITVGLAARVGSETLGDIAKRLLPAVEAELRRRDRGEAKLLDPVARIVGERRNRAQRLLDAYAADGARIGDRVRAILAASE